MYYEIQIERGIHLSFETNKLTVIIHSVSCSLIMQPNPQ